VIGVASSSSSSIGSGRDRTWCFSVWPSIISMTMNCWPLTSPMSKMVQMAGWFSELASRAGLRQQLRRQELDRDLAAEARVFGAIDHAHPAAAKLVEDAVVAADGGAR
jgi:hypothetical protein